KFMNPDTYNFIVQKISETRVSRNKFIKSFIAPLENELNQQKFKYSIKGRPKSIYSIYNKMQKQNIPFEEVYDLFAIRIIIDTPFEHEKADCWQVYSIVIEFYKTIDVRSR